MTFPFLNPTLSKFWTVVCKSLYAPWGWAEVDKTASHRWEIESVYPHDNLCNSSTMCLANMLKERLVDEDRGWQFQLYLPNCTVIWQKRFLSPNARSVNIWIVCTYISREYSLCQGKMRRWGYWESIAQWTVRWTRKASIALANNQKRDVRYFRYIRVGWKVTTCNWVCQDSV